MQKLQLTIPQPCHENWQNMTPTDQGRFCNACAKEVIDFSMMTDTEVLNYFTSRTHDKVCGRALPNQLERTISKPKDPTKRLFWYWNYLVMFCMFFGKGNGAKAQGGMKPITELSPAKNTDIRGEMIKVGDVNRDISRVITGKIMDTDGNPVSFALVKIKGTAKGVAADANGAYSMRINSNDILIISGAGFIEKEVPSGKQSVFNTVLNKSSAGEIVVVASHCFGGVKRKPRGETNIVKTSAVNAEIIFEIKEENTGLPIDKAAITITRKGDDLSEKDFSDIKGIYEFKQIKLYNSYFVKVETEGYEPNEFTIEASDFKDGKKNWQVLLKRENSAFRRRIAPAIQNPKGEFQVNVMGQTRIVHVNADSLYVIDGTMTTKAKADNLNPDDISDVVRLNKSDATALFGIDGSNGAVLITTRKAKEIKMKEVIITSEFEIKGAMRMAGGISFTNTYEGSFLGDTIATLKTLFTDSIKVYPNPVPRNTGFSVALKLKQAGNYHLQVTDAAGRILLQQKFNARAKNHTEKIMSDSRWAGGIYYIRVFDAKNKLISKSSFIVQ
ncbi:MAG: carboxypeptidase-like regulatory domain-containing protein [Chitinophagaceae bacterium]|nr:carboxypeptidase-like regulatory domain-containing protein [Chitinophagaceae bacterium]